MTIERVFESALSMDAAAWRRIPELVLALMLGGCTDFQGPITAGVQWTAELPAPPRLLQMTFVVKNDSLSGTGALVEILNPGGVEPLVVVGSRRADTLAIIFQRTVGPWFRFEGWFTVNGRVITGQLDGGGFERLSISFRAQ